MDTPPLSPVSSAPPETTVPTDGDQQLNPSPPASGTARLVQLTDCHLGPTDEYCLAGVRTLNSFREVIGRISLEPDRPDLVMASGDIAAKGTKDAYRNFIRLMGETGLPYAWLPGNHDDFNLMLEGFEVSPYCPVIEMGNWRLVSLNTAVPGRVEGNLAESELQFLLQVLETERDNPVLIFMHHPPMSVDCQWLDRQQVANGDALGGLLRDYGNVRAVFTGHVHQQFNGTFYTIPLFTTPATCFQFTPGRKDFSVDRLPPAYRWIDLFEDGGFDTGVVWIEDTAEVVDTDIDGY